MFFARIFFRIEQIHVFGYPQGKIPFNNPSLLSIISCSKTNASMDNIKAFVRLYRYKNYHCTSSASSSNQTSTLYRLCPKIYFRINQTTSSRSCCIGNTDTSCPFPLYRFI